VSQEKFAVLSSQILWTFVWSCFWRNSVCRSGSHWCCMLSWHDTSMDEEDPDNVNETVEIQDVLGALEFDYQST